MFHVGSPESALTGHAGDGLQSTMPARLTQWAFPPGRLQREP
jgi:hypothetical protein